MGAPVEPNGMTMIEQYRDAQAAAGQAAFLVERGVGATVETDPTGAYAIAVLDEDVPRAREVLGLVEVEREEPSEVQLIGAARPWLVPVLLVGIVLCVVPIVSFLVAFKLAGG
jgi:hypothetical protein